jgi:hypothetical protein
MATAVLSASDLATAGGSINLSTRLRRLAERAALSNPFDTPPLVVPPDYANSTALLQGHVVKSGGNMFMTVTAGTTASSGTPSTANGDANTNGTAALAFMGPIPRTADDPSAPTVTFVTSNPALGVVWDPVGNPTLYRALGATPQAYRTSLWELRSFVPAASAATVCRSAVIQTIVDDFKFAVSIPSNSQSVRIAIDGQFYSVSSWNPGGSDSWAVFDYTGKAAKKHRLVSVYTNKSTSYFGGVQTTTAGQIHTPPVSDTIRMVECADSLGAGAGPGPWGAGNAPAVAFGSMIGVEDVWVLSTGSTGDIANATNTAYNYAERVPQIIALAPHIIWIPTSTNDLVSTTSAVTAARVATLQALRAGLPNAIIVNEGIWPVLNGGNTAAVTALENAVKAAHDTVVDARMFWVPRATETPPWITSNNRGWNIAADGIHPPDAGSLYIARQRALAWRRYVLPFLQG